MLYISQNVRKIWPELETELDVFTKYAYICYGRNYEWNTYKKKKNIFFRRNSPINVELLSYLQFNYCNCGLFKPKYSINALGDLSLIFLNHRKSFIVYTPRSVSGLACLYFRQIWKIFENCSSNISLLWTRK